MKLITKTLIFVGLSTLAFSQETMCFKKNHTNLETIETVKLDGGLCVGQNSKVDMQKKGWYVKNIEMKNDYYVYIFKKIEEKQVQVPVQEPKKEIVLKSENISKEDLKQEIMTEIKIEKAKEVKKQKEVAKVKEYERGKDFYINKCASCHGIKGEEKIANTVALNEISLERFQHAIRGYRIGSYDLGDASEMRPYSMTVSTPDIKAIYEYLKKVK